MDYYIDNVNFAKNEEEFKSELLERVDSNRGDWKKSIRDASDYLRKAISMNEDDFKSAYYNGGFMEDPNSCYNQVISQLRLTDKKTRAKYEGATDMLVELFQYYLKKKKAGSKH